MAENSSNMKKTLCEKEKLLVSSNFSFYHSVFKRLVLQTRENQGLFGRGLHAFPKCIDPGQSTQLCAIYVVHCGLRSFVPRAKSHSSVGSVADLKTGDRWFNPRLGQYSFPGLMIVIATGFFSPSPLYIVPTMVKWESSQWLGKNMAQSTG